VTSPPPPDQQAQLEQFLAHAAELYALEKTARAAVVGPLRKQLAAIHRALSVLWVSRFGSLDAPADPVTLRHVVTRVKEDLSKVDPAVADRLAEYATKALTMGVQHAADEAEVRVAAPRRPRRGARRDWPTIDVDPMLDDTTRRIIDTLDADVQQHLHHTADALDRVAGDAFTNVSNALTESQKAVTMAEQATTYAVNAASTAGIKAVAAGIPDEDVQLLWVAERDACFIPSTRVLAPSVFTDGPAGASRVMAGQPLDGLALDPAASSMVLVSDPSAAATSAVASSMRDRFGNVHAVSSREYVGDVVSLRTASGKELTGTPNHPIATRGGWVALGELKVGDHVLSRPNTKRVPLGVHPDDNDTPPTIEQVAEAFPVAVRVVPTSAEDFHGDGAGSEVHVVRTDGLLLGEADPACTEHAGELVLQRRDVELPGLAGTGLGLSGGRTPLAPRVGADGCLDNLSPALGTECVRSAEVVADREVVALEPAPDRVHVDTVEYRDFLECLAGLVEADEIVEVRRWEFRGHVLNLETAEGWYLAEGIVAHNCVHCLAYAGEVIHMHDSFPVGLTYGKKPLVPWPEPQWLSGPPLHPNCRCRLSVWLGHAEGAPGPTLPEVLKREAQRSVLKGWRMESEPESVRLAAADRLLARGVNAPKSVKNYARTAIKRGRFPSRTVPSGNA
jgi:hypothetical protein